MINCNGGARSVFAPQPATSLPCDDGAVAPDRGHHMEDIRALSAAGMLGSGFREDTLQRAMAPRPDFIGADPGSAAPGPHDVGSGKGEFSDSACKRDLRLMLLAGHTAGIPVLVGSACRGGTATKGRMA